MEPHGKVEIRFSHIAFIDTSPRQGEGPPGTTDPNRKLSSRCKKCVQALKVRHAATLSEEITRRIIIYREQPDHDGGKWNRWFWGEEQG